MSPAIPAELFYSLGAKDEGASKVASGDQSGPQVNNANPTLFQ